MKKVIKNKSAGVVGISTIGPATESSSPVAPPEAISALPAELKRGKVSQAALSGTLGGAPPEKVSPAVTITIPQEKGIVNQENRSKENTISE